MHEAEAPYMVPSRWAIGKRTRVGVARAAETAEGGATRAVATRVVAAAKVELARDLVESFDYKAFKDFAARRFCE